MTTRRDYSLYGPETKRAFERGLVSAEWYKPPIPRRRMKELMRRSNFPALWHLLLWFALIGGFGALTLLSWGTWWVVPAYIAYCTILTSSSDPRWHECGHGTAFKTRWINNAVYNFASFFLLREPTVWRWSHTRHHTDSIIVGRDPEIVTPRPPNLLTLFLTLFNLPGGVKTIGHVFVHAVGRKTRPEDDFVPNSAWPKVFLAARIWIAVWLAVVALSVATGSVVPILFILVPPFLGHWLVMLFAVTQHVGLGDDVIDHRLNTRTIYMNPVLRFLYLNMNYHLEHHLFPMVPYHALPTLHKEIKAHCPAPYPSPWAAYAEIIPTLARQRREPDWWIRRKLPAAAEPEAETPSSAQAA